MRRPAEKDPKILIALGARLAEAKRTLSREGYDAFERREPELWHEATPGQLLHHKARRLIRLAQMQLLRDNIDNPPWTGLSTSHETSEVAWFHEADIPADLWLERVLPQQIRRMFADRRDPSLPTDFD